MEPDDQTMSERIQADELHEPEPDRVHPVPPAGETTADLIESDELRERDPEHVHPLAPHETLAERVEADKLDEPADGVVQPGPGRHVLEAAERDETLAERMESDEIHE